MCPPIQLIRYEIFFSSWNGYSKWSWHRLKARALAHDCTPDICLAAINHDIRSCHGVNITFIHHSFTFLTFGIGARYIFPNARQVGAKRNGNDKRKLDLGITRHVEEVKVKQVSHTSSESGRWDELKWQCVFNLKCKSVLLLLLCLDWDVSRYYSGAPVWQWRLSAFHC